MKDITGHTCKIVPSDSSNTYIPCYLDHCENLSFLFFSNGPYNVFV